MSKILVAVVLVAMVVGLTMIGVWQARQVADLQSNLEQTQQAYEQKLSDLEAALLKAISTPTPRPTPTPPMPLIDTCVVRATSGRESITGTGVDALAGCRYIIYLTSLGNYGNPYYYGSLYLSSDLGAYESIICEYTIQAIHYTVRDGGVFKKSGGNLCDLLRGYYFQGGF